MRNIDLSYLEADAREALLDLMSVYGDGFYKWLASLWDPATGGFYYSESARDNEGYLPDVESVGQILAALKNNGLFVDYGHDTVKALPAFMQRKILAFTDSLQDPDGFFYHPQWGKNIPLMRRGRDLSWAQGIYSLLGGTAPYPTADEQITDGGTAQVAEHLRSEEAFLDYLYNKHDRKRFFNHLNHELNAQHGEIKSAGLMPVLFDFLEREQDPETGLWGEGVNYNALTALMKGMLIYTAEGRPFRYAEQAVDSAIQMMVSDDEPKRIVDITNPGNALINILNTQRQLQGEEAAEALRLRVAARGAQICRNSKEKLLPYVQKQDVFSFFPYVVGEVSQNVPAAVPGTAEGDVNATVIAYGHLKRVMMLMGVKDPYIYGGEEYRDFLGIIDLKEKEYSRNL